MKKYLYIIILLYINSTLFGIELKPWQDWWQNHFDINQFQLYWGDQNAESRQLIRENILKCNFESLLDVGTGLGTDFDGFKTSNINIDYQAIEITPKLVDYCKNKGIKIIQADAEQLPFKDNSFDLVYSRHFLEHLCDYELPLNEFIRIAKKEIAIVFFIKPDQRPDNIDLVSFEDGSLLFHNRYNKEKLEKYILSNSKVKKIIWQDVSEQEIILFILLSDDLEFKNPKINNQLNREIPKPFIDKAISLFNNRYGKIIVEIGSMRSFVNHNLDTEVCNLCNDGHSTLLFARTNAELYTVDINPNAVQITMEACKNYKNVSFNVEDGITFLKYFNKPIDLLYLDGWDADPGTDYAEKHLEAYEAAKKNLHNNSLILIDDTDLYENGKGKLLIPKALKDGYKIIFSGRQTLLSK